MNQTNQRPRKMRWWIPLLLVGAAAGTLVYLRAIEQPFIEPITIGICLLTTLLLAGWYVFLTGLPFRTRFILALLGLAMVGGGYLVVSRLTRVEGSIGGSGVPRLVWKWSPKKDAAVESLQLEKPSDASASNTVSGADLGGRYYPQFLGANRLGVVAGIRLERDWQAHPPIQLWRKPIGLGWSAFAVARERAVTQEQRQEQELVVCYELETGRALWAHTNLVRFSEELGGDGPRATPTIVGDRVYAMGATGILDCLALDMGRLIWTRDVLRASRLSNITWGKSCSPLVLDDLVIVTGGMEAESSLLALRADSGERVWASGRDSASYSSPMVGRLAGIDQLLIVNAGSLSAHSPKTGTMLWNYAWPGKFPKVTQPLVIDEGKLLIAAGYGVGSVMLELARNSDGGWLVQERWKNRSLKPKFTNLVRRDSHVYGLDDGILSCVNLETGERVWKEGRYQHGQLLLVEDLLLIQAESGDVVLVEAEPENHREVARFTALRGKTWNNPVLAGDLLLVRNDSEAACYRLAVSTNGPDRRFGQK